MSSKTRTLAIALSAVLILSVLGSGLAFAGTASAMTNHEDTGEDCEVPDETDDGNETDDGGDSDDVNETDDGNETDDETTYEECESGDDDNATDDEPFGQVVTAYVHGLIDGSNDTNSSDATDVTNDENLTLGQQIASFVVEHNPGNAPDHAGPKNDTGQPDHAGPEGDAGKPAHAGNETGQPDHAGQDGDEKRGADKDNGGGPPEHAGNDD